MVVKRMVVGAHYGLRDWLAQRITGALIAVYVLAAAGYYLSQPAPTYETWSALFSRGWVRIATLLLAASVAWHAWVGVRDILMDYVKPDGLRLALEAATLLLLAVYLGWAAEILWR